MVLIVFIVLSFFFAWPVNLAVIIAGAILEVGEVTWGRRLAKRWRPKTGREAMIGAEAVVVADCRPNGQVRYGSELWNAECAEGASVGDTVGITALHGLTLVVAPVSQNGGR
jgi:membrane protein implicated in regulation of membrane protease activity